MAMLPCKDCVSGFLHEEKPKGKETVLHGLRVYVSEPAGYPAPKGIIVQFHDGFGWDLPNARVNADHFAERTGCRVYTPDFFMGTGLPADLLHTIDYLTETQPTWGATLWKIFPFLRALYYGPSFVFYNRQAVMVPRVLKFFKDMRMAEAAHLPVGIAGYCFGGLYTFLLSKDQEKAPNGKRLIDCGFTAHPSALTVPKDGEEAKIPVSVCIGDDDMALKLEDAVKLKTILEKNPGVHEMVILPGVKHGFAVRWNPHDAKQVANAKIAEDQLVNWCKKQMKI